MASLPGEPLVNNYKIPNWAAKPPPGLHLDVLKEGKLVQKLMIDEKNCYFFGRNRQLCDFAVDHQSCSRVHAVLVWHKNLNRAFIIDLGSVHGTFIGKIRLEAERPQQVPIDSEIHFGASKRIYVIRERPTPLYSLHTSGGDRVKEGGGGIMSTMSSDRDPNGSDDALARLQKQLPRDETELDNLTQFNTAHNRRITSLIGEMSQPIQGKGARRKHHNVHFVDTDEVINPEDVDPSVGRFRNLVQETFIPNKGKDSHEGAGLGVSAPKPAVYLTAGSAGTGSASVGNSVGRQQGISGQTPGFSLAAKLGLPMPNLAPDVDNDGNDELVPVRLPSSLLLHSRKPATPVSNGDQFNADDIRIVKTDALGVSSGMKRSSETTEPLEPKKKKYAKEAWPGKRPGFLVGPVP